MKRIGPQWGLLRYLMLFPITSDAQAPTQDDYLGEYETVSMLCELISGVSRVLYNPYIDTQSPLFGKKIHIGDSGERFRSLLLHYFPWDSTLDSETKAVFLTAVASIAPQTRARAIYGSIRNTLAHALGLRSKNDALPEIVFVKPVITTEKLEELESAREQPPDWVKPLIFTCEVPSGERFLALGIERFYWGVLRMLQNLLSDETQVRYAHANLKSYSWPFYAAVTKHHQ